MLRRLWSHQFGHLAHMPSHIDMQIGAYDKAILSNELELVDLELLKIRSIDEFCWIFAHVITCVHGLQCLMVNMAIKAATELKITPELDSSVVPILRALL